MILRSELCEIGYVGKPHGISGEMNVTVKADVDPADLSCIVFDIDGIFVPFFPESIRRRGEEGYLVKLGGVDTEREAAQFSGKSVYALEREMPEPEEGDDDGLYAEDMIGYRVTTDDSKLAGEIVDVDDSTDNILFVVKDDKSGRLYYIPVAEEFIEEIDTQQHTLRLSLPDGMLDL